MEQTYPEAVNPEAVTVQDCMYMHEVKGRAAVTSGGKIEGFTEDGPPEKRCLKRYPVYALIIRRGKDRIQWSTRRRECLYRKRKPREKKCPCG